MKALFRNFNGGGYLALALFFAVTLSTSVKAWDVKHTYTATGDDRANVNPTYSGIHYVYAKGPTSGSAISQLIQNNVLRAQAVAQSNETKCGTGWLQIGGGGCQFQSEATVVSGTAICIGYDISSPYYQQALCQPDPSQ